MTSKVNTNNGSLNSQLSIPFNKPGRYNFSKLHVFSFIRRSGEHDVLVRVFDLNWGGWNLSVNSPLLDIQRNLHPQLTGIAMTKNDKKWCVGRRKAKLKMQRWVVSLCDLEKVTLKPQLHRLQISYYSLLWGDSIRKGADLESKSAYSRSTPRNWENYFLLQTKISLAYSITH